MHCNDMDRDRRGIMTWIRGEYLLPAFEVIIEPSGNIRSLEPLRVKRPTRAVLTIVPGNDEDFQSKVPLGNASAVLELLQTPRFANRPPANPEEVEQRIADLRNAWGDE